MAVAEESYPNDLRYHREHDWVRTEGDEAVFGITWYAQDALGEVVYYDPPAVGSSVSKDGSYGELESVKAVSDIIAPASGEVVAVNDAVQGRPEIVNEDPYGEGWLVRVRLSDPSELDDLMAQRLHQLPGTSRAVLDALAVSGEPIDLAMLAALLESSEDSVYEGLGVLVAHGFAERLTEASGARYAMARRGRLIATSSPPCPPHRAGAPGAAGCSAAPP